MALGPLLIQHTPGVNSPFSINIGVATVTGQPSSCGESPFLATKWPPWQNWRKLLTVEVNARVNKDVLYTVCRISGSWLLCTRWSWQDTAG